MRQVPLLFPFALSCFFALFGTALFPQAKLIAFSPFLALVFNRSSFKASLWIASLCGLIVDLLSSEFHLGIHALNYCLTALILFHQKKHFFEDKPLALSLFTLLISAVSSLLQLLLISLFDRALPFSGKLIVADLFIMPLFDAVYAFCLVLLSDDALFTYQKSRMEVHLHQAAYKVAIDQRNAGQLNCELAKQLRY